MIWSFYVFCSLKGGLVPPRVVKSSHLFSYRRGGGLKAETLGAMFSTGRGKGKDKGKVSGK